MATLDEIALDWRPRGPEWVTKEQQEADDHYVAYLEAQGWVFETEVQHPNHTHSVND